MRASVTSVRRLLRAASGSSRSRRALARRRPGTDRAATRGGRRRRRPARSRRPSGRRRRREHARTSRRGTLPFERWRSAHATGADAHAIEAVRVRGWQVAYRHVFPPAELDALADRRRRAGARGSSRRRPAGRRSSPSTADSVVGFASVGPSRDEHGLGELYAIYVEPDAWSTGAGRALLERAEEQLARRLRRGDALGARGQPARPRGSTRRPAGRPTARARRRRAGACARRRCATARRSEAASRSCVVASAARAPRPSVTQRTSSTSFCARALAVERSCGSSAPPSARRETS